MPTPGLRGRFGDADGDLVNVSVSGALIRTDREVRLGSTGTMTLDLDGRQITLEARVVRSVAVSHSGPGQAGGARGHYAVGVMFLDPANSATRAVAELCGGRVALEELAYGILLLGAESPIAELILRTLVDAGYNTHVVRDARKALGSAKETQADLVIVDLRQEAPSWWVLEAFAADPTVGGKSLLALVDAASLPPDRRRQLAEQHIRLLMFPFTPEELLTIVERALRESV